MRIQKTDLESLRYIADFRLMVVEQLAYATGREVRSLRARLNKLIDAGLLCLVTAPTPGGRGRPKTIYGIAPDGLRLLTEGGLLPANTSAEHVLADGLARQVKHQLLLGTFRLHLMALVRTIPELTHELLASTSPFCLGAEERVRRLRLNGTPGGSRGAGADIFVPDMAFCLKCHENGKALLFFLEVDNGTEPLTSGNPDCANISDKITRYQWYFHGRRYQEFQGIWASRFTGFRLLFLCGSDARWTRLCEQVRHQPPSDFVWLTTEARLAKDGLGAPIWARGGSLDTPSQSMAGRLAQRTPIR